MKTKRETPYMRKKTPNTERRMPNTEWKTSPFRISEDTPLYTTTSQRESTPNAQRPIKRKTPNTERRTPNIEWKASPFRINETSSEYGAARKRKYDLEDRLLDFAVAIVELTDELPNTRAGNHIAGQLLRCGTSPYGHHGEVESAESRKDFVHKLKVCLKELRETRRWLRLVSRLKTMNRNPRLILCLTEAEELIRIFVASVRTSEQRRP
jgi:four helix bundle protein